MFHPFRNELLLASLTLTELLSYVSGAALPPPAGPFNTTLAIAELTDHDRNDPYASLPTPRRLMISIFEPMIPSKCSPILVNYIEPITAAFEDNEYAQYGIPAGTFERPQLQVCKPEPSGRPSTSHREPCGTYPLVIFSPGLGISRLFYSAMAQEYASPNASLNSTITLKTNTPRISSHGYIVLTIDHPYDADIVVFPDNTTIFAANISTDDQILASLNTRTKDVSFILNQFSRPSTARNLLANTNEIDVSKVGIYGHSLGGATAAQAMLKEKRLVGGVNLDGTFFGDVVKQGLDNPFLIFAHEGKNRTTDPSWGAIWPNLRGWKRELMLEGSAHGTFTDLPDVVDVLGIGGSLPSEVGELLGSIDGERAHLVVAAYVSSFFDFVLKGKKSGLLDRPSDEFPEVEF